MFTHVTLGTNDPDASARFYDATFGALGIEGGRSGKSAYYGGYDGGFLSVGPPIDGAAATHANGGTVGLKARSQGEVDAWHAAGLANGGSSEGAPGRRDMGPNKLYGAYLRDPCGNKLAAFTTNVDD